MTITGNVRAVVPTLEDVASRAGVSRATASRAVNGVPHVRAETRRAVQRAVKDLGYIPNTAAASLVTRRTGQVALVMGDEFAASDPVLADTVRDVASELSAAGMTCVLSVVQDGDDLVEVTHRLRTVGVEGAIVATGGGADAALCGHLRAVHIPVVALPGDTARAGVRRLVNRLR